MSSFYQKHRRYFALGKAKIFSKVNCSNGYWKVPLDEESSLLTTFHTPFRRYKWKHTPFGILPAGEIFQQRLDQAIEGLDGVFTIVDDILIVGNGNLTGDAIANHDHKMSLLLAKRILCVSKKTGADQYLALLTV